VLVVVTLVSGVAVPVVQVIDVVAVLDPIVATAVAVLVGVGFRLGVLVEHALVVVVFVRVVGVAVV
jgi:hypothetical protein